MLERESTINMHEMEESGTKKRHKKNLFIVANLNGIRKKHIFAKFAHKIFFALPYKLLNSRCLVLFLNLKSKLSLNSFFPLPPTKKSCKS